MPEEGSGLPSLPTTVDLGGPPPIEGDPLAFMQKVAREAIEMVNKNKIVNPKEKLEFKQHLLKLLKENIIKFKKIDKKAAAEAAAEAEAAKAKAVPEEEEEELTTEEKDPFADIFGEEEGGEEVDAATQEKTTIAQKFVSNIKIYKEQFLKKVRISREKEEKITEEKKMEEILAQLK